MSGSIHKPIEVHVEIYRLHVVVVIGYTVEQILKWGKKRGIEADQFTPDWIEWIRSTIDSAQGFCANFGDKGNSDILIWLKTRPTCATEYGTLWHEISHAVDKIAKHCDPAALFFADNWMSEPRAFLYEYLAVEISKDLWNRNDDKKKTKRRKK